MHSSMVAEMLTEYAVCSLDHQGLHIISGIFFQTYCQKSVDVFDVLVLIFFSGYSSDFIFNAA